MINVIRNLVPLRSWIRIMDSTRESFTAVWFVIRMKLDKRKSCPGIYEEIILIFWKIEEIGKIYNNLLKWNGDSASDYLTAYKLGQFFYNWIISALIFSGLGLGIDKRTFASCSWWSLVSRKTIDFSGSGRWRHRHIRSM